MFEAVGLNH